MTKNQNQNQKTSSIEELSKKVEQQASTIESLLEANERLLNKIDHVAAHSSTKVMSESSIDQKEAKEGHKFIKVRILEEDGDLGYGIIEVPKTDKRKAVDPNAAISNNRLEAGKGNPMANAKTGSNDIVVTGI